MSDDNLSPEERLFRVIQEDKKTSAAAKNAGPTIGQGAPGSWRQGLGQWRAKIAVWKIFSPRTEKDPKASHALFALPVQLQGVDSVKQLFSNGIDLNVVNRMLVAVLVGLTAIVGHQVFRKQFRIEELMAAVSKIKFETSESKTIEDFQPAAYYLELVQERDMFNPATKVEKVVIKPPEPPPPPPPKPQLQDMAKGLKMVGIAWGTSPKAMIKDEATQEIYFLQEKELIGKTQIEVRTILRDKVIIGYEQEEMGL